MDAKHVLVTGPSGGGKTTFLRECHARHNGPSVFLTTKGNERKAISNPPYRIRKSSCAYPRDIQAVREWAQRRDELTQVIVDECDNAPTFLDGDDGPLRGMLHEDRSRGVKAVIATQNPQDLHNSTWKYGPLQQCEFIVWVGPAKTWHKGFRQWLNLDAQQLPDSNYSYVVIDPQDPPVIVNQGETDPSFA